MKILHISSFDYGEAGSAAVRLHKTLLEMRVDSKMLVLEKRTKTPAIYQLGKTDWRSAFFKRALEKLGVSSTYEFEAPNGARKLMKECEDFSSAQTSFSDLADHPLVKDSDVIHLHRVAGFLDYSTFFRKVNKPIIWTQHDVNAFHGGFHYDADHLINKQMSILQDQAQYQCKLKSLAHLPSDGILTVSPSRWMMNETASSEIMGRFNHVHIPDGIEPDEFTSRQKMTKGELGLDSTKITVLISAEPLHNTRKGFHFIAELVKRDNPLLRSCEFVAVGNVKRIEHLPQIKYIGTIHSEAKMNQMYRAADIFLNPGKEDNAPRVVLESLATGTPVAAFSTGGMSELIVNGFNGFLSDEISTNGLYQALAGCMWHLNDFKRDEISVDLRSKYSLENQAKAYLQCYNMATMQTCQ